MMRPCDLCGRTFATSSPRARWCSDRCRKRWERAGRPALPLVAVGGPGGDDGAPRPGVESSELVERYRRALADVDRLDTPLGQHVLVLASKMTAAFETGSGVAALSRQLDLVFDKAMKGVSRGDAVDELEQRRRSKMQALGWDS